MSTPKLSTDLMSYYAKSYENKNGVKPRLNRNTAKWAARDIIDSFGMDECLSAIDWYFNVKPSNHDWTWYANNVEKLLEARDDYTEDIKLRKERLLKAKEWLS
jgi:hypothetical protein